MNNEFLEIRIPHHKIDNHSLIDQKLYVLASRRKLNVNDFRLVRRSIDARKKVPEYVLRYQKASDALDSNVAFLPNTASHKGEVHIIGAGPAGYFAALRCLELGLRPIVLERGKDVRMRRRDLRAIQQFSKVDGNSNYCFGEGGAGTYSDGKLYTRSKKKGDINYILKVLVEHGADHQITIDAHPHIGSNKLPKIIANIRQTIRDRGGEVRFGSKVTDIIEHNGRIAELVVNGEEQIACTSVILATGHSARDIFHLMYDKKWALEFKPFALGVRIEHPQSLIDQIQYGCGRQRPDTLPAASYQLTCNHAFGAVYSFCMCPGGLVVPACTSEGEIVLNGMSLSRRDSPFSNAGTVVAIDGAHMGVSVIDNPLAGLVFQQSVEQLLFDAGDGSLKAPTQRLVDFCNGKHSKDLPITSYIPGNWSAPLHTMLPVFVVEALQNALPKFGHKMKGYFTNEAVLMATESRTSSPVKIPRNEDSLMHPQVEGLFPCGEGAGYAGGIVSAALDGRKVADHVGVYMNKK